MMNGMKTLKRILVLCVCLALLAGAACADSSAELKKGEADTLYYDCTLPDGRILMSGRKGFDENDNTAQTWLVCLNTDMTVSWEYVSPVRDDCQDIRSVVLKDGRIALVYSRYYNDEDTVTAFFFTQDGQSAGEETVIPAEGRELWIHQAAPSFLMLEWQLEEKNYEESEILVLDWDGREVGRFNTWEPGGGFWHVLEEDDGVVLFGQDHEKRAKILKKDGTPGNTLWETPVDFMFQDTELSYIMKALKCSDGGYVAWIQEYVIDPYQERIVIAKFGADGALQWINKDYAEQGEQYYAMTVYNDKIVMRYTKQKEWYPLMSEPMTFRWLGLDGKGLGTTELTLNPDSFPALQATLAARGDLTPVIEWLEMIPTGNGLLGLVNCFAQEDYDPNSEWITVTGDSDTVMIAIPEP